MAQILDLAEEMWAGERSDGGHAWRALNVLEEVAERTWFYSGFANSTIRETDDGLVIIDPGAINNAEAKHAAVREVSDRPLHTAIYTHGHLDHVWGVDRYEAEAKANGWPAPQIVAHELVPPRFARYRETRGYNGIINLRQFRGGAGTPGWPADYPHPTVTYRDQLTITAGGVRADLRHARGETDDATWVYFPDSGTLCTGDLFVWVAPNAGNPQKVQRYCGEWAEALREMAALDPQLLLPGHGPPIFGAERVRLALDETASYLESIEQQTLALMNEGLPLDEVVERVAPPVELAGRPYLRPVYDEPDFIVRNIWRLFGGWYDGQPSHLKPATERAQAVEVAGLAGGAVKLAERAEALIASDLALACHVADWAYLAAPDDEAVRATRGRVYLARSQQAQSTMAVGIYRTTALEMGEALEGATFDAQQR
ncbi:MAG: alkyl sulfatase dimerization domain-containing protein [Dehalococcoidia bacterium]